jgi:nucleoside-diphosphate-sugar epimerase
VKVVITGHHGYIGSALIPVLREAGHDVLGIDTLYYEGCDLEAEAESVRTLRLDVRDVGPQHLTGADAVVHLAALSNDPLGELRPELTREINYEATVGVARAARDAGVSRFVFASSCSMYGATDSGGAVDERAPLRPLSEYARSKIRSEEALEELARDGFSPVFMRNATAYGASPRHRVDLVLNNLVAWAHTTGVVRILSDGTPWRPLVHIEDIARATLAMLEAPSERVHGQAFNVGADSENYQVRELAEIVEAVVPGCRIEYAGTGEPDPRSYRVDFGKLADAFPDLSLRWNARRGAEELAAAYARAGLTLAEFDGDRYTRLRRLERLLERGRLDEDLRWPRDRTAAHAVR